MKIRASRRPLLGLSISDNVFEREILRRLGLSTGDLVYVGLEFRLRILYLKNIHVPMEGWLRSSAVSGILVILELVLSWLEGCGGSLRFLLLVRLSLLSPQSRAWTQPVW